MPRYKTLRIREEDYDKLKQIQRQVRKRGTDSIDWDELNRQDIVDVPDAYGEDEDSADLRWGILIGLGAAALGYFLWKNSENKK